MVRACNMRVKSAHGSSAWLRCQSNRSRYEEASAPVQCGVDLLFRLYNGQLEAVASVQQHSNQGSAQP